MERRLLSPLQCAYILGNNPALPLGGTGCHAYLEFQGKDIDPYRLQEAWKSVLVEHEALCSRYLPAGVQEKRELPYPGSHLRVMDYSACSREEAEEAAANVRADMAQRTCAIEEGDVTSLRLLLLPGENRLCFDWNLVAGDVYSFLTLLEHLCIRYENRSAVLDVPDEKQALRQRAAERKTARKAAGKRFLETASQYPISFTMPLETDPKNLSGVRYRSGDCRIEPTVWKRLLNSAKERNIPAEVLLFYALCLSLGRWVEEDAFLVRVPLFHRKKEECGCIGDFTELTLVPFYKRPNHTVQEAMTVLRESYCEAIDMGAYGGIRMGNDLKRLHPQEEWIAPVVFSPALDMPLISEAFEKCFGEPVFMISQTPQVWLDAQAFRCREGLYMSLVFPEGLFSESLEDGVVHGMEQILRALEEDSSWRIEEGKIMEGLHAK